jgi:hypothetical protein
MKYDTPEDYYIFPLNYNDEFSSVSYTSADIPTFGYYGQTIDRYTIVDGWGTLILPTGSFNVLRIKTTLNVTDTVYLENYSTGFSIPRPETIEYKWFASNGKIPQLTVEKSVANTKATYQDPYIPTSRKEVPTTDFDISLLHNPSIRKIDLIISSIDHKKVDIEVLSISGSLIYSEQFVAHEKTAYSSPNLKPGLYVVKVWTDKESIVKKVLVQ